MFRYRIEVTNGLGADDALFENGIRTYMVDDNSVEVDALLGNDAVEVLADYGLLLELNEAF